MIDIDEWVLQGACNLIKVGHYSLVVGVSQYEFLCVELSVVLQVCIFISCCTFAEILVTLDRIQFGPHHCC